MFAQLSLSTTQKLALTPQLQQALRILQLPTLDLIQEISAQLEKNPLLEVEEPTAATDNHNDDEFSEPLHWEASHTDDFDPIDLAEAPRTLSAHLLEQLNCRTISDKDKTLIEWLIGSLNDHGFLSEDLEAIACGFPINLNLTQQDWQNALETLQSFDPIGIAARNYIECFVLQLQAKEREASDTTLYAMAKEVLQDHYESLAKHKYSTIQKSLDCDEESLRNVIALIATLNPHPAAEFDSGNNQYIIPEVEVIKHDGQWVVRHIDSAYPRLSINSVYARAIQESRDERTSKDWQNCLSEAKQLVKSISQRQDTLMKVADIIVKHQQDFFTFGAEKMKPLVLRMISDELGIHESTVSRITNGKYLVSPRGTFELKYFFSTSVSNSNNSEDLSSTGIKAELKRLLDSEDPKKPLSDAKLSELLQQKNITVARRTVAKYREALGYPAALERKIL